MFNTFTDAFIDTFQSGKKNFVNTFVQHEGIAKALNQFVDAQTAYTKSAVNAGIQSATSIGMIVSSKQFMDEITSEVKNLMPTGIKAKSKKEV
jgi:hypothetical protein